MVDVSPYFGRFPKLDYKIDGAVDTTENVTNIFRRYGILRNILSNASSYVLYEVEDGETPEILADKVYKDAGAGWIILYANQIIDPQFDWPLSDENFKKYIVEKFGSISTAQTTIHHYEKVVETTVDGEIYTRTYNVGKERYTENHLNVPYTYYTAYSGNLILTADTLHVTSDNTMFTVDHSNHYSYDDTSLPEFYSYEAHNVGGKTIYLNTYGNAVSNYDYEQQLNDDRKVIKVIKSQYYSAIMSEFISINKNTPSYIRTF